MPGMNGYEAVKKLKSDDRNVALREVDYRAAVRLLQAAKNITFSTNSVHCFVWCLKQWANESLISINTLFKVRTTYENFKFLLQLCHKIISFNDEIFFTLHTTVIQQICSTFSVTEQSMHKAPPITLQKTNSRNTSIYNNVKIMKNVRKARFPHIVII